MIISDGTTDLTFEYADENIMPDIEKSTGRSASGRTKSQTAGERMSMSVKFRTTPAGYRTLLDLMTNGANEYYYTPEEDYGILYSTLTEPWNVNITNIRKEWDNKRQFYVTLNIETVDYV